MRGRRTRPDEASPAVRRARELAEARRLFDAFGGSSLYLSREPAGDRYLEIAVPKELERQWLEELTVVELAHFTRRNNFQVIAFLNHHLDPRHLDAVLRANPRGRAWARRQFLLELLDYGKFCRRTRVADDEMARRLGARIAELGNDFRQSRTPRVECQRVRAVMAEAERIWGAARWE